MYKQPEIQFPNRSTNRNDDGNILEIDLPGADNASNAIPDEVPGRPGPGGEPATR